MKNQSIITRVFANCLSKLTNNDMVTIANNAVIDLPFMLHGRFIHFEFDHRYYAFDSKRNEIFKSNNVFEILSKIEQPLLV